MSSPISDCFIMLLGDPCPEEGGGRACLRCVPFSGRHGVRRSRRRVGRAGAVAPCSKLKMRIPRGRKNNWAEQPPKTTSERSSWVRNRLPGSCSFGWAKTWGACPKTRCWRPVPPQARRVTGRCGEHAAQHRPSTADRAWRSQLLMWQVGCSGRRLPGSWSGSESSDAVKMPIRSAGPPGRSLRGWRANIAGLEWAPLWPRRDLLQQG